MRGSRNAEEGHRKPEKWKQGEMSRKREDRDRKDKGRDESILRYLFVNKAGIICFLNTVQVTMFERLSLTGSG